MRRLRARSSVAPMTRHTPRKRRIYELRSSNLDGATLRVPAKSRCVPVLDALVP